MRLLLRVHLAIIRVFDWWRNSPWPCEIRFHPVYIASDGWVCLKKGCGRESVEEPDQEPERWRRS